MRTYHDLASLVLDELNGSVRAISADQVDHFRQMIIEANRIFTDAKGRSGLYLRGFAMRLMHAGFQVHVVDDVTTPSIGSGDLLIIASGSGRTTSLVSHAAKAKSQNAQIALITATADSPVAEQADCVILIPSPSPKAGVPSTGVSSQPMANLFEQSLGLLLDITSMQIMDQFNLTSEQMFTRHANLE